MPTPLHMYTHPLQGIPNPTPTLTYDFVQIVCAFTHLSTLPFTLSFHLLIVLCYTPTELNAHTSVYDKQDT